MSNRTQAQPPSAYLHGFASSPDSFKGVALRAALAPAGVSLALPDLNAPSFEHLTYTSALAAIDAMDAAHGHATPWRLIGSSLGGYLAARWAQLNPSRVERLVLLCPAFEMLKRWPRLLGAGAIEAWERTGRHEFPDHRGVPTAVHYGLIDDAAQHPAAPAPPCPTLIIHGIHDEVVPIETSRRYCESHGHVELLEVDSDHGLVSALDEITAAVTRFWGLPG